MSRLSARVVVALPPRRALELWLDTRRWATWVEGFGSVTAVERGEWPEVGTHLIWAARPGARGSASRGRVTEMVREYVPAGKHAVDVFDDRLNGRQTVTFAPEGAGSELTYALDFSLNEGGVKWIFARRTLQLAIDGSLRRFAIEAAEEASLLTNDT